jgi:NADH-quinone oxidoreductase subunit M
MLANIIVILPFLVGILMTVLPKNTLKLLSIIFSIGLIKLSLFSIATYYQDSNSAILISDVIWIESLGSKWLLTLDGMSLLMCFMASIVSMLIFSSIKTSDEIHNNKFYALAWMMIGAMIGVFTAKDGLLFYVFWELALIPIYFICLLYGGENKNRITFKFFLYTLFGSLFMLAALLYLHSKGAGGWDLETLYAAGRSLSINEQQFVFWALFLGFAIKVPIFPFHTWQPDTYFVAPTQGTMLLSGAMLKMGTYGIARWLLPMTPDAFTQNSRIVITLCIISVVYASIIAIQQSDIKRLFAWSSIAHVGLICAGLFAYNQEGLEGAFVQMLSHGINVVGLFIIVDIIFKSFGSTEMKNMGGLRNVAPIFSVLYLIVLLASVALPLTNGFVGEFLLILGLSKYNIICAAIAGLTVILGAVYMLRSYQKVMLGEVKNNTVALSEIGLNDRIVLIVISLLIFVFGLFPNLALELVATGVRGILDGSLGNIELNN